MTKQDATAGFSRFWVSRATPLTLAALLFAASCDLFTYKRPFPDAYYENNFIANIDFDENVCADGPATVWVNPAAIPPDAIYPDLDGKPVPVTGRWDLAYRYDEGWEGFNYITVLDTAQTASAYGGATGLVPNAPVYRVEVANLVQGGNFELNEGARFAGTGSWSWQQTANPLFGSGSQRIDLDTGESVTYTSAAVAGLAGFSTNATYNLFFRYNCNASSVKVVIDYLDAFLTLNPTGPSVKGAVKYTINNGYSTAPEVEVLPIDATSDVSGFFIDNFRVGRKGNMELRLYLKTGETNPAMVPGTYSFSVWAYPDPTARDYDNPYKLDMFRVKMAACAGTTFLSTTTAVYAETVGWQKLTATLKPGALSFPDGTPEPVLALIIDLNESRPGSVLLAQPELRFYPDGL